MDNIFILKLVLSFIVGSLWITMGTVLAEKYGTKIGGLIAGLPSTILIPSSSLPVRNPQALP